MARIRAEVDEADMAGVAAAPSAPDAPTDDAFLGGALSILQPPRGYRAGIDAVLLAATVDVTTHNSRATLLDLGAGVGTVGLSVVRRTGSVMATLLEPQPELVHLARENIVRNGLEGSAIAVEGGVGEPAAALAARGVAPGHYDFVVANPPFHTEGAGTPAATALKSASHAMPGDELDVWVRAMARYAAPGGTATLIHKSEALGAILAACTNRFGALRVLPIHPRRGAPAIRVIVTGHKGSKAPLTLLDGLVLHGPDNAFTPEASAILRRGAALPL